MKVLVSGANGQLGQELMELGQNASVHLFAADLPELDITRPSSVADAMAQSTPDLLVNAAAYTHVDGAESDRQAAFAVNRDGPANLAAACADAGIPLIHISTDYVFDGLKNTSYVETDPVSPVGVYAQSKAEGEARVRELSPRHVILRTAWLYSPFGHNFVKTMLRLGKERNELKVVADQFGTPTSARDLADAILRIATLIQTDGRTLWGTYHCTGRGVASWYDFAREIFSIASSHGLFEPPRVMPITTAEYPTPARRPPYSALDCALIRQKMGIECPPWQESLKTVIDRIVRHAAQTSN